MANIRAWCCQDNKRGERCLAFPMGEYLIGPPGKPGFLCGSHKRALVDKGWAVHRIGDPWRKKRR